MSRQSVSQEKKTVWLTDWRRHMLTLGNGAKKYLGEEGEEEKLLKGMKNTQAQLQLV